MGKNPPAQKRRRAEVPIGNYLVRSAKKGEGQKKNLPLILQVQEVDKKEHFSRFFFSSRALKSPQEITFFWQPSPINYPDLSQGGKRCCKRKKRQLGKAQCQIVSLTHTGMKCYPFFAGKLSKKKRFMETNGCCEQSFNSYRPDEKENHFCFLRGHSFSLLKVNFRHVQASNYIFRHKVAAAEKRKARASFRQLFFKKNLFMGKG